jgi:endonuclease YncB( thermonuclease family)
VDGKDHLGKPVTARIARAFLALVLMASTAWAEEVVAPAVRDVTPPGMTPGPKVDGPLVREPVPPRRPDPPRWRRYFLPVTTDAATFVTGKLTIHLFGVVPPSPELTCTLADGTTWACGQVALFSLRRFLRGRAIECLLPYIDGEADVTAPCRVVKTDLALWLLQQGWVKPADGAADDYRAASLHAQCLGVGLWRDTPKPTACPPQPG